MQYILSFQILKIGEYIKIYGYRSDCFLDFRSLARTTTTQTSTFNSSFIDGIFVYRQGSQNVFHMFRSIYPLHFDVKDTHIHIHIIFHKNFTQKTRSTASIYFYKVTVRRPRVFKNLVLLAMSSQKNRNTHDRKFNAGTYEIL